MCNCVLGATLLMLFKWNKSKTQRGEAIQLDEYVDLFLPEMDIFLFALAGLKFGEKLAKHGANMRVRITRSRSKNRSEWQNLCFSANILAALKWKNDILGIKPRCPIELL